MGRVWNVPVKQTLVIVEKTTLEIARRGETDFKEGVAKVLPTSTGAVKYD